MRIDTNNGVYKIRPQGLKPTKGLDPGGLYNRNNISASHDTANGVAPVQSRQVVDVADVGSIQGVEHTRSVRATETIPVTPISPTRSVTTDDTAQTYSLEAVRDARPAIERYKENIAGLVAGKVQQPITFESTIPPTQHFLNRAYFRTSANNAGLNAAAVDRINAVDIEA